MIARCYAQWHLENSNKAGTNMEAKAQKAEDKKAAEDEDDPVSAWIVIVFLCACSELHAGSLVHALPKKQLTVR